jgi:cysteinyl-tRNA synthetase
MKIYNSYSKKKEEFVPIVPGKVGMYGCGITPYKPSHLGHAMQAVIFDVMRRYFEYQGYQVTYVRNFTDVDDKIINTAISSPKYLTTYQISYFW